MAALRISVTASMALALVACRAPRAGAPAAIRLVDRFKPEASATRPSPAPPKLQWTFAEGANGWTALSGVAGLAAHHGRLTGRATNDLPILHAQRAAADADRDLLSSIEVRLRVSAGHDLAVRYDSREKLDVPQLLQVIHDFPTKTRTPLVPGDEMRTYTLRPPVPVAASSVRRVLLQPTDAPGARFEIESVRLVFRKEHLASIPSGVSWQALAGISREALVSRSPETIRMDVDLLDHSRLDLSIGTVEDDPVTFRVMASAGGGKETTLLERTVTAPYRWESAPIPLVAPASPKVALFFSLSSEQPGRLGFWGSPVVRHRGTRRGVVVIWADTPRADHLEVYGYSRPTSPSVRRMAEQGTLFRNCLTQATWTKVSTPTLMTSLYPTSHGVREWHDRIPASTVTMAEVYRDAGYATFSFPANGFTGQITNLHKGFDEVHAADSFPEDAQHKNARLGMDRLFAWLEVHRDVPFFAFLNFMDPHDPYKPYPPYDTRWADPAKAEAHEKDAEKVRKFIANPLLKWMAMATRGELLKAGLDPAAYVGYEQAWYDGSIRAMDAEIGRLLERLRSMGLDRSTLVLLTSDHGEEFLEHGRMFHGQSPYGELNHAPLVFWQPDTVPPGKVVDDLVGTIDLMPTLLEMSGLSSPPSVQGRSLVPLLRRAAGGSAAGWTERPTITEKLLSNARSKGRRRGASRRRGPAVGRDGVLAANGRITAREAGSAGGVEPRLRRAGASARARIYPVADPTATRHQPLPFPGAPLSTRP